MTEPASAIARRISGKTGPVEDEIRNELLDLREHVGSLEQRLAESEERIDFTERLLTQRGDNQRLEAKVPNAGS